MMAEATVVASLSYEEESTMVVRSTAPTKGVVAGQSTVL